MVADGYWLKTENTHWRRVTVADYLEAMIGSGLFPGFARPVPRDFKTDGLRGTTVDPNSGPPRETPRLHVDGRTLTQADYDEIMGQIGAAMQPLILWMQQFAAALLAALGPISEFMAEVKRLEGQQCQDPATTTSGEPTPTPTDLGSNSRPASGVGSPTGGTSTS